MGFVERIVDAFISTVHISLCAGTGGYDEDHEARHRNLIHRPADEVSAKRLGSCGNS